MPVDDDNDDETSYYGWIACFIAVIAYGSFGVPIKQTKKYNVHPLVLQSYKTLSLFACCWLVPLLMDDVQIKFTNWGYVSGLLWVLGGTGGIYAIRQAGMAVAIGTWASVMIVVNFTWGVLVFKEPIAHVSSAIGALSCLGLGVIGMSHFSAPEQQHLQLQQQLLVPSSSKNKEEEADIEKAASTATSASSASTACKAVKTDRSPMLLRQRRSSSLREAAEGMTTIGLLEDDDLGEKKEDNIDNNPSAASVQMKRIKRRGNNTSSTTSSTSSSAVEVIQSFLHQTSSKLQLFCFNSRKVGILAAVFNGLMTGSSLFPIHYAKSQGFGGANYLISLACGSMAANVLVWVLYYLYNYCYCYYYYYYSYDHHHHQQQQGNSRSRSRLLLAEAYQRMPSWYLKQIWVPGFIAGAILSLGQLCSVIAVTYLGQAVGNSIIQLKILVSGLWGIFWYKEITGSSTITGWFASATLAIVGIVWLSLERLAAKK